MIRNDIIKKILQNAILLEEQDIGDLAWKKEDLIQLVNSLMDDDIIILGGDVYKIDEEDLTFLGDNWSCTPKENETRDVYAKRSKIITLEYVNKYPIKPREKIIFSMTFNEQIAFDDLNHKDDSSMC